jgi:hypothetical protein
LRRGFVVAAGREYKCEWSRAAGAFSGLGVARAKYWRLCSATDAEMLPQAEPGAIRESLIMPLVGRRNVAGAEWPDVGCLVHLLQLLNVVNDAFNVHVTMV